MQHPSVTIVKVGGSGSRGELNNKLSSSSSGGGGHLHLYQQQPAPKVASSSGSRNKLDKSSVTPTSSSTALTVAPSTKQQQQQQQQGHRSMTKLSTAPAVVAPSGGGVGVAPVGPPAPGGPFDTRMGIYKSMTRLNAASQQNMARYNSSGQVQHHPAAPPNAPQVARSVTCITNSGAIGSGGHYHQRVSAAAGGGRGGITLMSTVGGANSPTKSMSSGSMSGVTALADGREVLTVNVDQINADLLRQASTVLSQHGGDLVDLPPVAPPPTSSYTHIASIPITTHSSGQPYHSHLHHHHYHQGGYHHHGSHHGGGGGLNGSNPHHLHSLHVTTPASNLVNGGGGITTSVNSHGGGGGPSAAPFSLPSHSSRR